MPERGLMDRLLPCLLDRLTDDEPQNAQESRDRRVISLRRYRQSVLQDLEWLMNTRGHGVWELLEEFPYARRSVLNFGLPDFEGMTVSVSGVRAIEQALLRAIQAFEPRINPGTLRVKAVQAAQEAYASTAIVVEIQGVLWAQPVPEQLFVRTEIDLETGQCRIKDRGNG